MTMQMPREMATATFPLARMLLPAHLAARMDYGSSIRTNILSLKAEIRGYDMALTDDPNPTKKSKLEEQIAIVQAEVDRLKVEPSKNASGGAYFVNIV
jgi:hypothetical protein